MKISIKELKKLIKNKKRKLDEAHQVGLEVGRSEMPRDAQTWQKLAKQFEETADEAIKKQKELEKDVEKQIKLNALKEETLMETIAENNRLTDENAKHLETIDSFKKVMERLEREVDVLINEKKELRKEHEELKAKYKELI